MFEYVRICGRMDNMPDINLSHRSDDGKIELHVKNSSVYLKLTQYKIDKELSSFFSSWGKVKTRIKWNIRSDADSIQCLSSLKPVLKFDHGIRSHVVTFESDREEKFVDAKVKEILRTFGERCTVKRLILNFDEITDEESKIALKKELYLFLITLFKDLEVKYLKLYTIFESNN